MWREITIDPAFVMLFIFVEYLDGIIKNWKYRHNLTKPRAAADGLEITSHKWSKIIVMQSIGAFGSQAQL